MFNEIGDNWGGVMGMYVLVFVSRLSCIIFYFGWCCCSWVGDFVHMSGRDMIMNMQFYHPP